VGSFLSLVVRYNLRSLTVRSTDAIMTLFGIALASAVVVVVSALGSGIERAFVSSGSEDVAIVLQRGAKTEVQGRIGLEAASIVATLDGVVGAPSKEVVVLVNLNRRGGAPSNVLVRGISPAGVALRRQFRIVAGREVQGGATEVIAARRMSERFQGLGLGESFTFGRYRFQVVGLFEAGGTADSEVWGPLPEVQAAFDRREGVSEVRLRLAGATERERSATLDRIVREVASNPRLPVTVQRETDYYKDQEESASDLPKMLGSVLAVLMAIGGAFGAMNSMFARVAARTREIGTLRAIGWRRPQIVTAFLIEALLLGLAGGVIGVLIALPIEGLGSNTTSILALNEVTFVFHVTKGGIAAALVLAAMIGLLGGLLPALKAARLGIPESLKEL
jgi:ABC-type antimicrobial peptide transport system permease subunit